MRSPRDPLSICFFSHSSYLAGAERTLLELVTQLIEEFGVRCTVVVPGNGPLASRLEEAGGTVIRTEYDWWCDTRRIPETEAARKMDTSIARLHAEVLPILEAFDPDVVCTQTLVIPYGALAAEALGKPHIWNLREQGEADGFCFFKPFVEVSAFIRDHSDYLFGANRKLCLQVVPGLSPEDHDVLYPVVHGPQMPVESASIPSGAAGGRFRLVELATMAPSKRLDIAIEAVAELTARGRMVELGLAGDQFSPCVEELERLIRNKGLGERVHIDGFLEDVFPAMMGADAVVISAPVHGFGRTAAEGMACAKPVVYPLGTGFDDYIEDGVTGLGYSPGDPQSMADQIDRLIENADLCREIGTNAQTAGRATFTRDGFGGKFFRRALELSVSDAVADRSVRGTSIRDSPIEPKL